MKPTVEMVRVFESAWDDAREYDPETVLTAVMPLIERAVAEQIAEQIELFSEQCGGEPIKADIAAWIARAYPDGYDECCGGGEVVPYDDDEGTDD